MDVIWERNKLVHGIELNPDMEKHLKGKPYRQFIKFADFLELKPELAYEFERVVMNPPFTRQQDIDHIYHAFKFLGKAGVLVSLLSPSPFFRTNKKSVEFRAWLEKHKAEIVDVPAGAFKESGTPLMPHGTSVGPQSLNPSLPFSIASLTRRHGGMGSKQLIPLKRSVML